VALVCVGSVRAAPGATTLAMLVSACWPRSAALIEADPAGGVLAIRYRLGRTPGLADLAAAVGNHAAPAAIWSSAQPLPGGLAVVVAPEAGDITGGILADVAGPLGEWCAGLDDADVIVDFGRVSGGSPALGLAQSADVVMVVARPRAEELYPAAHRIQALAQWVDAPVGLGLVLVGSRPHGPEEITRRLGVRVLGGVADDPRAAAALRDGGSARGLRRSLLVRSVQSLVDDLAGQLGIAPVPERAESDAGEPVGATQPGGEGGP
jgi:hypothetical protein